MLAQLRCYWIDPGKRHELLRQFSQTSLPLFAKHGITIYGPWIRVIDDGEQLVYVVECQDRADWDRRWDAFRKDPHWDEIRDATGGPLMTGVRKIDATDMRSLSSVLAAATTATASART
jgi:NIPSNAP